MSDCSDLGPGSSIAACLGSIAENICSLLHHNAQRWAAVQRQQQQMAHAASAAAAADRLIRDRANELEMYRSQLADADSLAEELLQQVIRDVEFFFSDCSSVAWYISHHNPQYLHKEITMVVGFA
jgi:hypothetical protein